MHASIWKFTGDPDELTARYDSLLAEMPTGGFIAHLCLRAPDGIVIVDTCPSQEAFEGFATSDEFRDARRRHGIPDPSEVRGYPVHAAFIDGAAPSIGVAGRD
jgi:heme-degrading monooxygenase HmoA